MAFTYVRRLRIAILGAVDGTVYSATMFLLIGHWRAAADARNAIEGMVSGDYVQLVNNERWIPIVLFWIVALYGSQRG